VDWPDVFPLNLSGAFRRRTGGSPRGPRPTGKKTQGMSVARYQSLRLSRSGRGAVARCIQDRRQFCERPSERSCVLQCARRRRPATKEALLDFVAATVSASAPGAEAARAPPLRRASGDSFVSLPKGDRRRAVILRRPQAWRRNRASGPELEMAIRDRALKLERAAVIARGDRTARREAEARRDLRSKRGGLRVERRMHRSCRRRDWVATNEKGCASPKSSAQLSNVKTHWRPVGGGTTAAAYAIFGSHESSGHRVAPSKPQLRPADEQG